MERNAEIGNLKMARRFFGGHRAGGGVANEVLAAEVEAKHPGSRWMGDQGKSGVRRYLIRMYFEISGQKVIPVPRVAKAPKKPFAVEGVDVASADFTKTWAWRKLRYQAIRHYGAKCMCCGATRESGAVIHVDHIKPRRTHPELALKLDNLQILCGDCNAGKGNWDETDWRPVEKTDDEILDMEALADLRERGLVN